MFFYLLVALVSLSLFICMRMSKSKVGDVRTNVSGIPMTLVCDKCDTWCTMFLDGSPSVCRCHPQYEQLWEDWRRKFVGTAQPSFPFEDEQSEKNQEGN